MSNKLQHWFLMDASYVRFNYSHLLKCGAVVEAWEILNLVIRQLPARRQKHLLPAICLEHKSDNDGDSDTSVIDPLQ